MQTIQRKSLVQEVYGILRDNIQTGVYKVDQKLPTEPALMQQFGVGRSTIREAVKLLVNSGYVSVQQGIGTSVISTSGNEALDTTIEKANFTDLLEVRQLLEVRIAEKAALQRTNKDIARINQHLKKRLAYARSGQTKECIEADIAFHVAIADSCGNTFLAELYKVTSEHISKFFMKQYKDTTAFIKTQLLHQDLLQQIKDRDARKALKAVNKIIGNI
jgi:DNA-binding FadR family transcriptional regulator